jgi:hypothetical protein
LWGYKALIYLLEWQNLNLPPRHHRSEPFDMPAAGLARHPEFQIFAFGLPNIPVIGYH